MKQIPLSIVTRLSIIFSVLGFLLIAIGLYIGTTVGLILLIAGLIVLVGTIIFIAVFSRCPHCGGFLKYHKHYCPHCGNYVD